MFQSGKIAGGRILRNGYPSPVEGTARRPVWLEQRELTEDSRRYCGQGSTGTWRLKGEKKFHVGLTSHSKDLGFYFE